MASITKADIIQQFEQEGWSEVVLQEDGKFWGFNKGAVMPTPIPQATVLKVLGEDYKQPFRPSLHALLSTLNSAVIILISIVSAMSVIPFLFSHNTLYRVGSINSGEKSTTEYETYRRPYTLGNATYFLCNSGIAKVSGNTTYIVVNPDSSEKDKTTTKCR